MVFDPNNNIVKLCIQGMALEESGNAVEAANIFLRAWKEATNDFEKFTAAYYVARHQNTVVERLKWLEESLRRALTINDVTVKAAFPALYTGIARCYEELGQPGKAKENHEKAASFGGNPTDGGPFYHGTKADLKTGELLTPGATSNYDPNLTMNHIYFTAMVNGAGLAAALAKGEGAERVYIVEPVGSFENDPNVTDKKFPGNPTRSYRSREPLRIVGEVSDWARLTPEQKKQWKDKLANNKGEIIN